ncbi:ParA family protein [Amphritea sp. 2_MG-2023]|jgi:chromosome partitioning protein|uniref:ParA family protein n=1 Tax=Amphritea TaxID=515417 RepID=UPI001C07B239|nr:MULTISPECIES: ParA family protein [Amphritea]MBU2967501.1 ParA family protein [Amphritea atlantica]MDO6420507.1 ParA family protein [Amphritea sp. 2_MG-2023]
MIRVVFNQKGGVGKSSISTNLAAISASQGKRTLVVDLDSQCNTSHYLLGDQVNETVGDIKDFFEQMLSFQVRPKEITEFIHGTAYENLDLLPSSPELGDLHAKLEAKHKIYKLRDALLNLDQYDAIYIDTPPAFNFYTLSALCVADSCLIPFDCDEFSRQALYSLMYNVQETQQDHNDKLTIEGIVVNQYQPRANASISIVEMLKEDNLPVLNAKLSSSVKMKESHNACVPLVHFAPKHKLTLEYLALYDELSD